MSINSRGFTLVEVLVIAPIVILFIGVFISFLVNLTGESLSVREKNVAAFDSQAALDSIESDIQSGVVFLTNSGAISAPQGKKSENDYNNSTASSAAFTNETGGAQNALIIRSPATDRNPSDTNRQLVYTGAGSCDATNPLYMYITVYFVGDDYETAGDTTDKALYKRTILPLTAACRSVYQTGSCEPSQMSHSSGLCKKKDERLVGGITNFDVGYFRSNGSSVVAIPDSESVTATDVSVSLTVNKKVAGSTVNYFANTRASSQNVQSYTISSAGQDPAPSLPTIQFSRNDNGTNPYRTNFSWAKVGNATNYLFRYRLNGGSWVEQTIAQSDTPNANVDAGWRKQTVEAQVDVVSPNGTYNYGSRTATPIPNWNDCQFSGQGAWNNYGTYYNNNVYTTAGYTRTSSGIVGLKGLVKGTTLNVPICTLPEGFRPKFAGEKLIFQVASGNGANWGRIDIHPNGDVVPVDGNTEWFSLDGILFMSDSSNTTWTNHNWLNSWTGYGFGHSTLRSTVDNQGRRHVQGLGSYSNTAPNGVSMTNIGSGTGPSSTLHYPAMSAGPGIVQPQNNGTILTRSSPYAYQQLQMVYRNAFATGWQNMPFSSGWTNFLNGFPTMQCHRGTDDVVIIQGLIRHPTDGNGTYIGDTSPCGRFRTPNGLATGTSGIEDRLLLSPWTSNEAPGRIDMINGVSLLSQGTAAGWTALDGFHFIAD